VSLQKKNIDMKNDEYEKIGINLYSSTHVVQLTQSLSRN
jgi:hypothetical protein